MSWAFILSSPCLLYTSPDSREIENLPCWSMTATAGSLYLSLINGAIERTAMPAAPIKIRPWLSRKRLPAQSLAFSVNGCIPGSVSSLLKKRSCMYSLTLWPSPSSPIFSFRPSSPPAAVKLITPISVSYTHLPPTINIIIYHLIFHTAINAAIIINSEIWRKNPARSPVIPPNCFFIIL